MSDFTLRDVEVRALQEQIAELRAEVQRLTDLLTMVRAERDELRQMVRDG